METTASPISPTEVTVEEVKTQIAQEVGELIAWVLGCQTLTFFAFEVELIPKVLALGRLFVQLFLCMREAQFQAGHPQPEPGYQRQGPNARWLGTFFGKVRYWRTYYYRASGGYYPLDIELGLTGDGFSLWLQSCVTRIATKVSYAQTVLILNLFLGWAPAQESIEGLVLGLGRYTGAWFESAPAPAGDGEVLVIQFDGKATPTATETELEKRRGAHERPTLIRGLSAIGGVRPGSGAGASSDGGRATRPRTGRWRPSW